MTLAIAHDVPLAPLTTLGLGGPARHYVTASDEETALEALRWASARALPVLALGGGSNLVISDAGFPGLVIHLALRGMRFAADECAGGLGNPSATAELVDVAAGEPWDGVVAETVQRGLAGLECLSGIPGLAGATPIQNVGAYGQEVAETVRAVRAIDRQTLQVRELSPAACAFGYRDSAFKHHPDRWLVLGVTFALRAGGAPSLRYPELQQARARAASSAPTAPPTLAEVRDIVLALRRAKSMVIAPDDPNRRSVGSFFMNPIVPLAEAARLVARLLAEHVVADAAEVPQFPAGGDRVKLSAAWLIERAGLHKGFRQGAVGISSRHALALVHHGGGTTAALLALADLVRDTVERRFGVRLAREPVVIA